MPSKYQPQVSCWREDLHKGIYTTQLQLTNKKLRIINDDYCELSRRLTGMRCLFRLIFIIIYFICLLIAISGLIIQIHAIFHFNKYKALFIFLFFLFLICNQILIQVFITTLLAPEDCPVRFNRKTGKVYIYDHFILYFGSWATFIRSPFKSKEISIKEFDWANIQGVVSSVSTPIPSGGILRSYRIECLVCKPNTTIVVDHFILSIDNSLNYDEWMWLNSYMMFSDTNLNNELIIESGFEWFIKIKWPEEIDRKSKAGSVEAYLQIDAEYKEKNK
ncbi:MULTISPECIES: DUF6708 domain-containing protein [unclassified Gilliamella]|uniref:DUF6708 domain-containing protein n=1 Tax=unclassified Gilliamella TaxID=2685620 RepID=UPI00226AEF4F|nr:MULTISPECIES: DUF6708 domain-containing protein [unclassified Gilliamella]MCX8574729.1 hypothetical protein [Gilliamella sp. B3831]MCX8576917.1 hypothetical protein [Gilliamella sp. B3815]MCX8590453.1 hypothetical protein [Gilliamella sp. B3812]MCX8604061.1 hypothetical protein [Gilliamella sp. B3823]MCX8605792.1 hypothetical protein [Gilliamella sp. B3825]